MLRKGVKLLIKKMADYKKALVAILENTLENVNAGNTNITEEEASVIIDHLTMLNKGAATVSKAYACEESLFEIMKDFHEKLIGKHFTEPYALYQVSQMYHTNNKGIKIDAPLFSIEATKKIYDRRIRPLNKDIAIWDVYVALNAQYHDNINLYEKWFPNATNNEIEDKIVEATISNWFEDEDASSDKVWEYFRVI